MGQGRRTRQQEAATVSGVSHMTIDYRCRPTREQRHVHRRILHNGRQTRTKEGQDASGDRHRYTTRWSDVGHGDDDWRDTWSEACMDRTGRTRYGSEWPRWRRRWEARTSGGWRTTERRTREHRTRRDRTDGGRSCGMIWGDTGAQPSAQPPPAGGAPGLRPRAPPPTAPRMGCHHLHHRGDHAARCLDHAV